MDESRWVPKMHFSNAERMSETEALVCGPVLVLLWGGVGLGLALLARQGFGYPHCPGDEGKWVAILEWLDQGIAWPVSGPGFVWVTQRLSTAVGLHYDAILPLSGTVMAGLVPPLLYGLYRCSGLSCGSASGSMACLMVSSYFLGPLLEARPQQWGMVPVMAALILYRRLESGVRPLPGVMFLSVYGLTFLTHLLSFIVLNGLLGIRSLWTGFRGVGVRSVTALWWLGLGLAVMGLMGEEGPYRIMLQDLRQYHFHRVPWVWLTFSLVMAGGVIWMVWRWFPTWGSSTTGLSMNKALVVGWGGLLAVGLLQAWLAPPQYLAPYQGELWRFLLVQSGNILFALSFFLGVWKTWNHDTQASFYLSMSVEAMVLGMVVLGLSPWLGDKNGLIRVMNYWILFAAPVAWEGLGVVSPRIRLGLLLTWPVWVGISLVHVVRPSWILSC